MKSIKVKANALTIGYLEEQLTNVIQTHEQLTKLYEQKLQELDLLETQQQAIIDSARKELSELFSGPTAVALSKDAITSAKILTKFSKENENLKILGGIMGTDILDVAGVKNVATLPSLEEARAKIVGILRSPAQKIASILLAPASKIAILALEKSKK